MIWGLSPPSPYVEVEPPLQGPIPLNLNVHLQILHPQLAVSNIVEAACIFCCNPSRTQWHGFASLRLVSVGRQPAMPPLLIIVAG